MESGKPLRTSYLLENPLAFHGRGPCGFFRSLRQSSLPRILMEGDIRESLALYPDLERNDPDRSFDQVRAAQPLRPFPLIVQSADRPWGPQIPSLIAAGKLPTDVPADFGYVTDKYED